MSATTYDSRLILSEATSVAKKIESLKDCHSRLKAILSVIPRALNCRHLLSLLNSHEYLRITLDRDNAISLKLILERLSKALFLSAESHQKLGSPSLLINILRSYADEFDNKAEDLAFSLDEELKSLVSDLDKKFVRN